MRRRFAPMSVVAPILITIILFSSLIVAFANPSHAVAYKSTASTVQAQDNLPFPPRWRGQCDTNNYSKSLSNPNHLSAYTLPKNGPNPTNYRGVFACGPRPIWDNGPDVSVQFFKGAWPENEWECVELSMRYMYLAYGVKPYSANGYDVVSNYQKYNSNAILIPIPNSNPSQYNTVPQPGDIVSYYSNHTAVVTATNVNTSGNGTITLMEQNNSANGIAVIKVGSNAGLPPWVLDQKIKNWLHHTLDVAPQSGSRGTSVHFSGTGFAASEPITITFYANNFKPVVVGTTTANKSGAFSTILSIPVTARPGTYFIQATGGQSKFSPQTVFYVLQSHSDWPMVGYDPQLTHSNPTETVLNPTNVSNLTSDWSYTPGGTSVAVVNNIVYFGAVIGSQSQLVAVDAITHALKWSFALPDWGLDDPTVSNGVVYMGSGHGLYAVDALTGVLKWSFTNGTEAQSPVVVNGIAYFGSMDGTFNAVDATTGILKWKITGGSIYTRPAVVNGVVYVSSDNGSSYGPFYALDALTGTIIWSYSGNANAPTIANGVVYLEVSLGNGNGFGLIAFDAASGAQRWMFPLANSTGLSVNTLAVANGVVFAGAFSGNNYNLYAVDAATGGLHWSFSFGEIGYSLPPAIANGVFYFATPYGNLFALNVATGAQLWNGPQLPGNNTTSLVVADGVVYIETVASLYTFHLPGTTP